MKKLERIADDRGTILKMQESTDKEFKGFGEIYFFIIYSNSVKNGICIKKLFLTMQ